MSPKNRFAPLLAVLAVAACCLPAPASAAPAAAPAWTIRSVGSPTNFSTADSEHCEPLGGDACDTYIVSVTNVGSAPSSGRITIKDKLPQGIVEAAISREEDTVEGSLSGSCNEEVGVTTVTCGDSDSIPPGGVFTVGIEVKSTTGFGAVLSNFAEVEGGGALTTITAAPSTQPNTMNSGTPPAFGVQDFSVGAEPDGTPNVQAGSHPALLSTTIDYTTLLNQSSPAAARSALTFPAVQEAKTIVVDLPLGLVGDPLAAPECPEAALAASKNTQPSVPSAARRRGRGRKSWLQSKHTDHLQRHAGKRLPGGVRIRIRLRRRVPAAACCRAPAGMC